MISGLNRLETMYPLLCHPHAAREEIVAFQNRQLRHLITHAYNNVPYYRRLFDQNGLTPHDIRSIADLPAIPIKSKKDLQSLPAEEVVANGVDPEHLISHRTSGSSGEPFTILRTWLEERLLGALRLRALHYLGLRVRDRTASIALVRPTHPPDYQLPLRILQALGLYRKLQIDCLLPPENIVRALRHFRPDGLTGFSGVISYLSQIMNDNDSQVIRPRFLVVGPVKAEEQTINAGARVRPASRDSRMKSHEFNLV